MNENIGAKGGKQDRRRSLKIKKKNLAKMKQKQRKREKNNLRKEDIKTFFKIIPIAIIGEGLKVIFENKEPKKKKSIEIKQEKKEESNNKKQKNIEITKKERPPTTINFVATNVITERKIKEKKEKINQKNAPEKKNNEEITMNTSNQTNISNNLENQEKIIEQRYNQRRKFQVHHPNNKEIIAFPLPYTTLQNLKKHSEKKIEIKTKHLQFKEQNSKEKEKKNNINNPSTLNKQKKNITREQIKTKKINNAMDAKLIDEYTKKLYDVRYSLKKLIYEYNTLVAESDDIYTKKEAEMLLYKLNIIIKKIEELKQKVNIEDIDKYDDSYIYNLVNEYIKEFENKNFIDEIKDSDLYITLSEKIQELDIEKEKLENKLELRKEKIESDEKNFEIIKNEYDIFAKFDQELIRFQNEQLYLLKELESNIENSLTITEKVEAEVKAMNNQCKKLLELIALQMMIPKLKSTRNIITSTMIYMYYMRRILKPEIKTKRYKIINITDYSKDIENSLYQIDNITEKLEKTSKKLSNTIKDFEEKYQEYFDVIPECKNLLNNLKTIENNLKEKEYEINRLKQQQIKNLETNNEKVKRLNNKIENIPQKKEKKYG